MLGLALTICFGEYVLHAQLGALVVSSIYEHISMFVVGNPEGTSGTSTDDEQSGPAGLHTGWKSRNSEHASLVSLRTFKRYVALWLVKESITAINENPHNHSKCPTCRDKEVMLRVLGTRIAKVISDNRPSTLKVQAKFIPGVIIKEQTNARARKAGTKQIQRPTARATRGLPQSY